MNGRKHDFNVLDFRAIIRIMDDQEIPLLHDEQIALDKVKRVLAQIENGARKTRPEAEDKIN